MLGRKASRTSRSGLADSSDRQKAISSHSAAINVKPRMVVAAIGDVRRFADPQKLVSYVGLNPRGFPSPAWG